jgi:putative transposase
MSYTSLKYHVIFSTKDRVPLLDSNMVPRLGEYMGGIARQNKGYLLAANGPADHIHLAIALAPDTSLSAVVREIKAGSSKWLHKNFPTLKSFAWQEGYAAFSVSQSGMEKLFAYIESQPEHHKKTGFQEELIDFLQRHQIKYDEKYVHL